MRQTLMTIVARVKDGRDADLAGDSQDLRDLRNKLVQQTCQRWFEEIPSLHFSSMSIVEGKGARYFLWESNFDGKTEAYLELAISIAGKELKDLYRHCDDFKPAEDLYIYLRSHVVKPNIYHIGAPALTVRRVKAERHLVNRLEAFLDNAHPASFRSAAKAQEYLQQCAAADPIYVGRKHQRAI
jgi:hypothetical protein